jgi:prefoldin subunit 2
MASVAAQKPAAGSAQKRQLSEQGACALSSADKCQPRCWTSKADLQSLHRTTEAAQLFQSRRSELQGIASKVGELEGEADEHK